MSKSIAQGPVRCFCLAEAKRTNDNVWVCGHYRSGGMVCVFHLHEANIESYHEPNLFPMPVDCEMCLVTIKIHSKQYIAPCRVPSVRCDCGLAATFYQSKQENINYHSYFFGCPRWKTGGKCTFFAWADQHRTIRDLNILCHLLPSSSSVSESSFQQTNNPPQQEDKNRMNTIDGELRRRLTCVVCLVSERSYLVSPCNHLCCCSSCAGRIDNRCPICRNPIGLIQRIYLS